MTDGLWSGRTNLAAPSGAASFSMFYVFPGFLQQA
jgi:hypothetical protein